MTMATIFTESTLMHTRENQISIIDSALQQVYDDFAIQMGLPDGLYSREARQLSRAFARLFAVRVRMQKTNPIAKSKVDYEQILNRMLVMASDAFNGLMDLPEGSYRRSWPDDALLWADCLCHLFIA